ncbi:MAG: anthranilate synthase component I [Pirellula sp.]|nr:anthranilate synthase component I [Pirellula sp.]
MRECKPAVDRFRRLAAGVHLVPVYRKLLSDSLTPVGAFHRLDTGPCACLFESVVGGEKVGRYSFLTAGPFRLLEAFDRHVRETDFAADGKPTVREFESADPLDELKARVDALRSAVCEELPPFTGGAIGYAGYDTVRYVENLPNAPTDDRKLPDLSFAFFDHMVVFDNVDKTMTVIALARVDEQGPHAADGRVDLDAAYAEAAARVERLVAQLSQPSSDLRPAEIETGGPVAIPYTSNFTQAGFESAVAKCQEYIRAGDIFQVVLSQRLQTELTAPPFELYRTLRIVNPSPFMFYLRLPQVTLVGSSPEIMVRVVEGKVTVRPLAGTRPRGRDEADDRRLAEELLADPKERAEHVMLVDLGRNDVGRVAKYGSVELSDVMVIERYSHVMHITSNVTGQLADGQDAFDAMKACLPAGTVSGAPKVRAMQIIDEFEPHRRGPYAGAVGYIDFNGNMDTCIALRTCVVQNGRAYVQAGAGIVADSVPADEYQETLNKARGMLKAIEITERRAGKAAK